MKTSKFFLTTLFAAATALSVNAEEVILTNGGSTTLTLTNTVAGAGNTYIYNAPAGEADKGADLFLGNLGAGGKAALGSSDAKMALQGDGLVLVSFQGGNGGVSYYLDLGNLQVSDFSGKLSVLNVWDNDTYIQVGGSGWRNTEYFFGGASYDNEWQKKRGYGNADRAKDVLQLTSAAVFAGIQGASKGKSGGNISNINNYESIRASEAGTLLTTVGSGTYSFYGTVGAMTSRLSLSHSGTGSQTYGGTNYLQDVSVSNGTLVLAGTTDIAGGISTSGGRLTLTNGGVIGGEIYLGGDFAAGGDVTSGKVTLVKGEAVFSGALSATEAFTIQGGKATVEKGLTVGSATFLGGDIVVKGTVQAESVSIGNNAGTLDFKGDLNVGETLAVSGGNVVLGGTLGASSIQVSGGTLSVGSLKSSGLFNFSVTGGDLALNGQTKNLEAIFSVELNGGKLSGLSLEKATAGTVVELEAGELSGAVLSSGNETLVLYAAIAESEGESDYLNGEAAITISGGLAINSAASIDLSNLVFEEAGDKYALFKVGEGTTADSLVGSLNLLSNNPGGVFSYDEGTNSVIFTAGENMQFSLAWNATLDNKYWRSDSFQGDAVSNMESRSVYFGRLASVNEESVRIVTGAAAKVVTVSGRDSDVYKFVAEGEDVELAIGSLDVKRGTLDVQTAMTATSGIVVSGGQLIGSVKGALNVGETAGIEVSGGTLVLAASEVTDAKTIELAAGTTLELTANGVLNSITEGGLKVAGTEAKPTKISWNGSSDSPTGKLGISAGTHLEFNVESGEIELDADSKGGKYSKVTANYYKTGEGMLTLIAPSTLTGNMSVTEGTLALDYGGTEGVFAGNITVSGEDAVLRLANENSFGTGRPGAVTVTLEDGARIEAFGANRDGETDVQTMFNVALKLGDNTYVGNIDGGNANRQGLKLDGTSSVSIEAGATATIALMIQVENAAKGTFNVGEESELTLSGGVSDVMEETAKGALEKTGAGTLIISADPSARNDEARVYSGTTTISEGILRFSGSAKPGTGDVTVAKDAFLETETDPTRTMTFGGNVSGEGSIRVLSGTAEFQKTVAVGSAIVSENATLLLGEGYGTEAAPGTLVLDGTVGGAGAFVGSVTLGKGAAIYAGEGQTFNFNATFDGEKALAKTGAGAAVLESALPEGFNLTLGAGTLASTVDQTLNTLTLNGGALAAIVVMPEIPEVPEEPDPDAPDAEIPEESEPPAPSLVSVAWTTNNLVVGGNGGSILTDLTLNSPIGQSKLELNGELVIGLTEPEAIVALETPDAPENATELKVANSLLISANAGGVLKIGTVWDSDGDGNSDFVGGGAIVADHLEVADSLAVIEMANVALEGKVLPASRIEFNTGVFQGDVEIRGALNTSNIVVGEKVTFAGSGDSTFAGVLASKGGAVATINVVTGGASVHVSQLAGSFEKVGEGALNIDSVQGSDGALSVREGALIAGTLQTLGSVTVSGEGSRLSAPSYSVTGTSQFVLEDGAVYAGELVFEGGSNSLLKDATINGSLKISETESLSVQNLKVQGDVYFGFVEVAGGDEVPSTVTRPWKLTLAGTETAITAETLYLLGYDAAPQLSLENNFDVKYSAIGSEMTLVDYNGISCLDFDQNNVELSYDENGYVKFSEYNDGQRTFYLVADETDSALKIIAGGTLLWNGATEWNTTDDSWLVKSLSGTPTTDTFSNGDYVEFGFSGKNNAIAVKEAVAVSGVTFKGTEDSSFVVNFENGAITDWTNDAQAATPAGVMIQSGVVQFTGNSKADTAMFSGGLTILSGAELKTDNATLLGSGKITLGGKLSLDSSMTLAQDMDLTGNAATLDVADEYGVTLSGALSGGHLSKDGTGVLTLAGDANVGEIVIAGGSVVVDHAGDNPTESGIKSIVIKAAANSNALTFKAGNSLGVDASVTLGAGKKVVFEGDSTWLNNVTVTGEDAEISVAGTFKVGGSYVAGEADGAPVAYAGTIEKADSGAATLRGNLALQGSGVKDGLTAGLSVNVGNEYGTLTITGDVADAADENAGLFAFEKLGSGTLEIQGAFKTAGTVSVAGGTLNVGGVAELTGMVQVLDSVSMELGSGGTFGDANAYVVVDEGAALTLTLGGDLTIGGKLLAAGTISVNAGANKLTIAGSENAFTNIDLAEGSTLSIESQQFAGEAITLGADTTIAVNKQLEDSSGTLRFTASGSKIELSDDAVIRFDEIVGASSQSLEIAGAGEIVVNGSVGSNNTMNLSAETAKLTVDSDVGAQLGKLTGVGTLTKKGKGQLTASLTAKSSMNFTGNVVVDEGVLNVTNGSLGLAKLTVNENGEVVLKRTATIGAWDSSTTVADSLAGGAGTLAIDGEGNTLTFTKAIESGFTGTLEARNGGILVYNAAAADATRNVALTNGGLLSVAALADGDAAVLAMKTLAVSGRQNTVELAEGRTLEIADLAIVDTKGTSNLTFAGAGDATIAGTISKPEISRGFFDIYTDADFTGTLTLSGENNAHRDTYVNAGTVVFSENTTSTGTGKVVMTAENATVRFDGFQNEDKLSVSISGTGTIEGNSGTVTGLADDFVGTLKAIGGTFTIEKSGDDSLAKKALVFTADKDSTLVIQTDGEGSADVDTIVMGEAVFGEGDGTISLKLGTEQTLEIENSNTFAGTLNVASGSVKVLSEGNLGTAAITLGDETTLNVATKVLRNSAISGTGTLVKNTSGTSYIAGTIDVATTISTGALAVSEFGENAKITLESGTLELSKTLNAQNALVNRAAGDVKTFDAEYFASGYARFSHEASTARSIVNGELKWNGAAGTVLLVGGGEGSELALSIEDGNVVKSGSGKWTLSNFTSAGSVSLEVGAGTLAWESYKGQAGQHLSIGTDSVLEIAKFRDYTDTTIRGTISGTGTLAVSEDEGTVTLALDDASGSDWTLQVRNGAEVKVGAANELKTNTVEVQSNSVIRQSGGELTINTEGGNIELAGRTFTVSGLNKDANDIRNGLMFVEGGNVLDLTRSILKLGGVLTIKDGTVKVAAIERITPVAGVVNVQKDGTLEIGVAGSEGEISALAGTGKVVFVAGTTSLKNINMAQAPSEFNSKFYGTVEIQDAATVVLDSGTSFGNASSVVLGENAKLKVAQTTEMAVENLEGKGTLVIANKDASVTTAYGKNTEFSGNITVERGRLAMSADAFRALSNAIELGSDAASGVMLRNDSATPVELSTLGGKTNVSGQGSIFLDSAFSLADRQAFGYGAGVNMVKNASLAMGVGAAISGDLYVDSGAMLDLTSSVSGTRAPLALGSEKASRKVDGDFTLAGLLKAKAPFGENALLRTAGTATIEKTATIEVDGVLELEDTFTLVASDQKNGVIEKGALFQTVSGERLTARVSDNATKIVVGHEAMRVTGIPDGLEPLCNTIWTNTDSDIYKAIYWSGTNSEQVAKLTAFSPVSLAGALELSTGMTQLENDLLRQRLEQRRYDRAFPEVEGTIKGFANIIGSVSETDTGKSKSANYDLQHAGAVAGFDMSVSEDLLLGISFSYDVGKADVHNNGGEHKTDAARVNLYGMAMLDEVSYFGFGFGFGILGLESERVNALETLEGDASGSDISLSTTLGRMFVLDADAGLHVSPYVGLDYTFTRYGAFSETGGAESALDVDAMERHSLRGVIGATLNWLPSEDWRLTLEAAFRHEFMDDDADIDAKFIAGAYAGMDASATAYFSGDDTISIGPRVEYRINADWTVSAGYTFEADFESTTTHSANIGVRCKF